MQGRIGIDVSHAPLNVAKPGIAIKQRIPNRVKIASVRDTKTVGASIAVRKGTRRVKATSMTGLVQIRHHVTQPVKCDGPSFVGLRRIAKYLKSGLARSDSWVNGKSP